MSPAAMSVATTSTYRLADSMRPNTLDTWAKSVSCSPPARGGGFSSKKINYTNPTPPNALQRKLLFLLLAVVSKVSYRALKIIRQTSGETYVCKSTATAVPLSQPFHCRKSPLRAHMSLSRYGASLPAPALLHAHTAVERALIDPSLL